MVCITDSSPTTVLQYKVKSEGEVVCITVSSPASVQSQVRGRGGMYNSFVSYLSTKSSLKERWYV